MKIFSVHAGRTDFLELQVESLRYFCKDNFEYYCIDNFLSYNQSNFLKKECEKLKVNYIRFDNYKIIGSSIDHASALNSIKNITSDNDINVILDFDVFLISNFSFLTYIEDYNIAGVYQQRDNFNIEYLAPFVVIINKNSDFSKIDFSPTKGCDVGGNIQHYIKTAKVKLISHTSSLEFSGDENCFGVPYDIKYGSQVIESSFLHYYRGTNWNGIDKELVLNKTIWLKECLKKSKKYSILNQEYLDVYQTPYSHSFCFWNGTNQKYNYLFNPFLK